MHIQVLLGISKDSQQPIFRSEAITLGRMSNVLYNTWNPYGCLQKVMSVMFIMRDAVMSQVV
jgi:hypothetical protein